MCHPPIQAVMCRRALYVCDWSTLTPFSLAELCSSFKVTLRDSSHKSPPRSCWGFGDMTFLSSVWVVWYSILFLITQPALTIGTSEDTDAFYFGHLLIVIHFERHFYQGIHALSVCVTLEALQVQRQEHNLCIHFTVSRMSFDCSSVFSFTTWIMIP